jgi:hypothetical protein
MGQKPFTLERVGVSEFMKMFVSMDRDGEFWISNKRVFMKDVLLNSAQVVDVTPDPVCMAQ